MPDLDSALDELRRFASHPPAAPTPVDQLAFRASRRRRRRRAAGSAAAGVALVLGGLAITGSFATEDSRRVQTGGDPQTTTTSTSDPTPTSVAAADPTVLVVEPNTGLVDGQTVVVSGPPSVQAVAICDADSLSDSDPIAGCDINIGPGGAETPFELTVERRIQTANGIVDCAERPERCVVGVLAAGGERLVAPITFRGDLGDLPVPAISVEPTRFEDGDQVVVDVSGFDPPESTPTRDDEILIVQCIGEASDTWVDPGWDRCDSARTVSLVPDASGQARTTFTAHAEILTYDGWQPCDPCVLVASAWRQPLAVAPIDIAAAESPIRPSVRIIAEGPYEPGQRVRLEGAGFGARNDRITVGWCAFRTEQPETEIEGDPNNGYVPCAYPRDGHSVIADDDGAFVIEDFPLPDSDIRGFDCLDPAVRCGLAWHHANAMPPAFVTLFTLRQD